MKLVIGIGFSRIFPKVFFKFKNNVKNTLHIVKYILHLSCHLINNTMKTDFLIPHKYRKLGWVLAILSFALGLIELMYEIRPQFLEINMPSIFINDFFGSFELFGFVEANILSDLCGITLIVALILIAFSKEKEEDEYLMKVRLESLVWAVYVNYAILILAFIFIYNMSFFWVMTANMFTVLAFFIIRYNLKKNSLNKDLADEE